MHLRPVHCLARRYVGAIEDVHRQVTPPDAKLWRTKMRRVGAMPERMALRSRSRACCVVLRAAYNELVWFTDRATSSFGANICKRKAGIVHCSSRSAYIPSLVVARPSASSPRVCPPASGREQLRIARIFSHGHASGIVALLHWDTEQCTPFTLFTLFTP